MRIDPNCETAKLIGLCLEGRSEAWDALIYRYQDYVYSIVTRFVRSKDDRQDVFQNVFLILYQNLRHLKNREKLASYLFQITRRECLRISNLTSRAARTSEKVMEEFGYKRKTETPESFFDRLEEKILVRAAISKLSPRCRILLERLFLDDRQCSYGQLADELGMPESSIGPTRQRCLAKLRELLEKAGAW
jgi:RNA polymerase sigma factor (sigma-70 family)